MPVCALSRASLATAFLIPPIPLHVSIRPLLVFFLALSKGECHVCLLASFVVQLLNEMHFQLAI